MSSDGTSAWSLYGLQSRSRACVLHPIYYRHIYKDGLEKFKRFACNVWGISAEGKTDEETALAGIEALEDFILEIGLPVTIQELNVDEHIDLKVIADSCAIAPGSYKKMSHNEIYEIFKECFKKMEKQS